MWSLHDADMHNAAFRLALAATVAAVREQLPPSLTGVNALHNLLATIRKLRSIITLHMSTALQP
jgi:hypothetical protein